jgi:hypothetical protein
MGYNERVWLNEDEPWFNIDGELWPNLSTSSTVPSAVWHRVAYLVLPRMCCWHCFLEARGVECAGGDCRHPAGTRTAPRELLVTRG